MDPSHPLTKGVAVRIALGQLASGAETSQNLAAIAEFAAQAAADDAQLIAFPEYATYEKKVIDASFPQIAEPLDGPICLALSNIARSHRIAVVAGVVEASERPDKAYNTLVAFNSDGDRVAEYRKVHLFDAQGFNESAFIEASPSTDPVVFSIQGIQFGLMTCYDLRFPELPRGLSDAGAQVLLVCSSWVPGEHKTKQWQTLLAARAIENGIYVAGACQAPPVSVGHSLVADPMGVTVCEMGLEPATATAEISPAMVSSVREQFPTHRQRRLP